VPKDHFYRHLHDVLDLFFVRDIAADCYASGGRPSIDPEVFFRLQLLMFFAGIRSERQLMEQISYNLDEPLPDHSSLSKIRTRLGLAVFRRFSTVIVEQCAHAGLVWGKGLIFDATNTAQRAPGANASMDSLIPVLRLVVDDHLAALVEAQREEEASRWELLEECRLDPERPPTSYYERKSDQRVSTTDPDAALMRPRGGRTCLGYHDHAEASVLAFATGVMLRQGQGGGGGALVDHVTPGSPGILLPAPSFRTRNSAARSSRRTPAVPGGDRASCRRPP